MSQNSGSNNNNGGWFSSFSDQINQIKDVITNENPDQYYDDDENNHINDDDSDDQIIMLRAELNKFKMENEELEKRSLESEQRMASVTKEFSRLMSEKETEIAELRNINTNLKQTLMSPTSSDNQISQPHTDSPVLHNDLNGHSSLGLTLENENQMIYDDDNPTSNESDTIQSLQQKLKKLSENYQNQISTLQQLHQEKIYKLTHQVETLQQENEHANELSQSNCDQNTVLQKDNEQLKEELAKATASLAELNEKILARSGSASEGDGDGSVLLKKEVEQLREELANLKKSGGVATNDHATGNEGGENGRQQEVDSLKEQLSKSTKELARLRQHLLEIEDNHTTTDLENEEKISQLEEQLKAVQQQSSSNRVASDANDKLARELQDKDDELKRTTVALNNLQSVLEQFQADQEAAIQTELVSVHQKIKDSQSEINKLQQDKQEYEQLKLQFRDANNTIASLQQTLSTKEKEFRTLKEDIEPLKMAFDKNINRLSDMCLQEQESVDKRIVSKLFLTYFNVKGTKKLDVLELIAKILSFNDDEKVTIGLTKRQWSLIPFFGNGTTPTAEQNGEKSLTDMWIEFLLKEAQTNSNNNNNNDIGNSLNNDLMASTTPNTTPFSTPTKQHPMAPPPSPSTPFKQQQQQQQQQPINNNYFSVTPNPNGKLKSTVIYDGDIKNNL